MANFKRAADPNPGEDLTDIVKELLARSGGVQGSLGVALKSYTVATLPTVGEAGRMIYVTNETGGAVPAFSDGTNWRRVTDRAIVS